MISINEFTPGKINFPQLQQNPVQDTPEVSNDKFADTLKEFVQDVNSFQKESAKMTDKMIKGEPVELHDVMIAADKARTTFNLLMEVRNKFTDMYREVTRIQM